MLSPGGLSTRGRDLPAGFPAAFDEPAVARLAIGFYRDARTTVPRNPCRISRARCRCSFRIDDHRGTGHPFGVVAGEEQRHRGDIFGAARAANRLHPRHVALRLFLSAAHSAIYQRVTMPPGHMQLTRIRSWPSSIAALSVRFTTAALAALYACNPAAPLSPQRDAVEISSRRRPAHRFDRMLDTEEHRSCSGSRTSCPSPRLDIREAAGGAADSGIVVGDIEPAFPSRPRSISDFISFSTPTSVR